MRIAYIANYQGPELVARRPVVRNLSMSNRVKIELIATLLRREGHDVVLISPGEPGEPRLRLYPAFRESEQFDCAVPVEYASALPVRTITAAWSSASTARLLAKQNRESPFDLVIIFNMKWPQLVAAEYAARRLRLPIVLEYEDDAFITVHEERWSPLSGPHRAACGRMIQRVNGCIGVSPYLLSRLPATTPKLLLRGVVGEDIIAGDAKARGRKLDRVVFAGTHIETNGVGPLIDAWRMLRVPGWELHITGHGHLTPALKAAAAGEPSIVFHGLVDRGTLVEILSTARVCINPHKVSDQPGIVFAFKIIEYLAAGAHVVTTPMGTLEPELAAGVTYINDNRPETISTCLARIIAERQFERTAGDAARRKYGPDAVSTALGALVENAVSHRHRQPRCTQTVASRASTKLNTGDSRKD